jgi:hypothetical protein
MSRAVQIVCDGCGKAKQEANHWWIVATGTHQELNWPVNWPVMIVASVEHPLWKSENKLSVHDFCGQDCALKFIAQLDGMFRRIIEQTAQLQARVKFLEDEETSLLGRLARALGHDGKEAVGVDQMIEEVERMMNAH